MNLLYLSDMTLKLYLLTLSTFLAIDMVWLTVVARGFYAKHLGYLLAKNPNLLAAFIFYLIFVAGIVFFVLTPAIEKRSLPFAIIAGAFFGLVTYATYDLTNLATVRDWPLLVTVVDLIWGTVLSASVSGVSYTIAKQLGL